MSENGFVISSQCVDIIKEFNRYSYPEVSDTKKTMKGYDHKMDLARYFIVNWQRGYLSQKFGEGEGI